MLHVIHMRPYKTEQRDCSELLVLPSKTPHLITCLVIREQRKAILRHECTLRLDEQIGMIARMFTRTLRPQEPMRIDIFAIPTKVFGMFCRAAAHTMKRFRVHMHNTCIQIGRRVMRNRIHARRGLPRDPNADLKGTIALDDWRGAACTGILGVAVA